MLKKFRKRLIQKKIITYVGDVSIKNDIDNFFKLVKTKMKKFMG